MVDDEGVTLPITGSGLLWQIVFLRCFVLAASEAIAFAIVGVFPLGEGPVGVKSDHKQSSIF